MSKAWDAALHPRDFVGEFVKVGKSGNAKRNRKLAKSRGRVDKAQAELLRTASVRTRFGGQRPLNAAEARRFTNDTNVQMNAVQGHSASRRRAAQQVLKARNAHLKNFGRSVKPIKVKSAGHKVRRRGGS